MVAVRGSKATNIKDRDLRRSVLDWEDTKESEDTKVLSTKADRQPKFNREDTSQSRIFPRDLTYLSTENQSYHPQYPQYIGRSGEITLQW